MNSVLIEKKDGIAIITLNRPEKMNALTRDMLRALQQILEQCAADSALRAVYLTGSGRGFCAGQDVTDFDNTESLNFDQLLAEYYDPVVTALRSIELPVVCAVNGVAAGAGANIALCCDIVVAAESASFIQAFSRIGLIPDSGGTYWLPRLVGLQKAAALMMLGEKLSAAEAERCGMIYRVFPDNIFAGASLQLAATLAALPTRALALTKKALQSSMHNSLEEQLHTEAQLQQAAGQTADFREGVSAFKEKRQPVFIGR